MREIQKQDTRETLVHINTFSTKALKGMINFYTTMTMTTNCARGESLISTYLINLALKVVHHLGWHVFAQDLEEIDPLVPGDRFVGGQFDALLDLLYSRILRDKIGILSLPYRLIAEDLPVFLWIRRNHARQK